MLRKRTMMATGASGNDENTKLLLHFDGNLIDSSASANTVVAGAYTVFNTTYKKFGSASGCNLYDGNYFGWDRIGSINTSAFLSFLSNNWTVDFWVNLNDTTSQSFIFTLQSESGGTYGYMRFRMSANGFRIQSSINTSSYAFDKSYSVSISHGTFHHVAIVKNNNLLTIYVDGIAVVSDVSYNMATNAAFAYNVIGKSMYGYLDEFRFSNKARWTANFTPPTAPYA